MLNMYIYMVVVHHVCCSVLQCVAVCCSVLQCVAVCCSVLQCLSRSLEPVGVICVLKTRNELRERLCNTPYTQKCMYGCCSS